MLQIAVLRNDTENVKKRLEAQIRDTGKVPYEVIPVSIKMVDDHIEFLRHTATRDENEIIALREALRSYIDKIGIDIPKMKATIHFKNDEKITLEFRKSSTYPRTYAYRTHNSPWIDLGMDPRS